MTFPNSPGVYIIRNIKNQKVYIGSSKNLKERILDHLNNLKKNKHRNTHLQNSYNKYGENNFFISILDHYSEYPLHEIELEFINRFESIDPKYGYNKAIPNQLPNLKGIKKTKEHNLKNSISHRGSLNPNYGRPINEKLRLAIIESNKRRKHGSDNIRKNTETTS